MGNHLSGNYLRELNREEDPSTTGTRLDDVPENCLALVLMQLEPLEICKLAGLNRAFGNASSADFIWESKLPQNYRFLLEKVVDDNNTMAGLCKKDLYARLCQPNPFDGGNKVLWLDKNTGGVCLSISSKALSITGIDDRRQWIHLPTDESRFPTIAYLYQAWWVEVNGEFEFQFPRGTYSLFFRLQLGKSLKKSGRKISNYEHIHGWNVKPVRFELTTLDGQHSVSQCFLDNPGKWVYYHAGDFVVGYPNKMSKVKFSLNQIDCTHNKGGLCVDAVFVCPSGVECETFRVDK